MTNFKPNSELRILVVDDTPLVVTMLSGMLAGFGIHKISSATSVETAMEKFSRLSTPPFDVVFLDRYLGNESGLDILKKVRERFKALPIILLTQEDEGSRVIEAIGLGASDYIVKPFSEDIIREKLEKAVGRKFDFPSRV